MAWQHVSKDRKEAVASLVKTEVESNEPQKYLKLKGLEADCFYKILGNDGVYSGKVLMKAGIPVPVMEQYEAWQCHIVALEV